MPLQQAYPTGTVAEFKQRVNHRLKTLAKQSGEETFLMPVGIFLLVDKDNGGDTTAQELAKRFNLLDFESRNVIDFYFAGWHRKNPPGPAPGIGFDLASFESFREALRHVGVSKFGGNADLILVDAHYTPEGGALDFSTAIRVDLSASKTDKDFPTLGHFLQSIIEAAEQVRSKTPYQTGESIVFSISDELGIAMAKKSLLNYILAKFGEIIGAKRLQIVAVRNLGPKIELKQL